MQAYGVPFSIFCIERTVKLVESILSRSFISSISESTLIKTEFLLSKHSKALFYRFRVCKDHVSMTGD